MHTSTWVNDFLEKRGLDSFTGNPVYSYRISESEFDKLKTDLRFDLYSFGDYINSISFPSAFVLYACEWWRKDYSGSNWSWDPILQSLNMGNMSIAVRSKLTENGFKRLKRKLIISQTGEKEYLGTIAFESGIPRSLLAIDHYFSRIITEVFSDFQGISSYDLKEEDIVEDISIKRGLPKTYQNPIFYKLVNKLVDELIQLNDKFDLKSESNPIEFLNRVNPDWVTNFPIVADSNESIQFINNLLSDTSKKVETNAVKQMAIYNGLVQKDENFLVEKTLGIHDGIIDCSLLGITLEEWSTLSDISKLIMDLEDHSTVLGSLYKISLEGKFNCIGLKKVILTKSVFARFDLRLENPLTLDSIYLQIDSPNFIDSDSPLVYENLNDKWKLKSVGSTFLKTNTYRVLVRSDFKPNIHDLRRLTFTEAGIELYEIKSSVTFSDGDTTFALKISETDQEIRYHIVPSRTEVIPFYFNKNKHIFLGLPRIYQINSEGRMLDRMRDGVEFLHSNGEWMKIEDSVYGRLKIRKRDNRDIALFSLTIDVLPRDFRVSFCGASSQISTSSVKLSGIAHAQKVVESSLHSRVLDDSIVFSNLNQSREESFQLKLYSNYTKNMVMLKVPLPKDISSFTDEKGEMIKNEENVSMHSLLGKRLIVNNLTSLNKMSSLIMVLTDPSTQEEITSRVPIRINPFGTYELPLIQLRSRLETLFSLSANNNAVIKLSLANKSILVRQFDSKPYFNDGTYCFTNPESEVHAFRLDTPFAPKQFGIKQLVLLPSNRLNDEGLSEGKWFIYPAPESTNRFCPVILKKSIFAAQPGVYSFLHQASLIPDFEDRQIALVSILEKMTQELNDAQWVELCDLYDATKHLPLSTLDVWKAMEKSKRVLASSFFQMPDTFIEAIGTEFSVLWRIIKVEEWTRACESFKSHVNSLGFPSLLTGQVIDNKVEQLKSILGLGAVQAYLQSKSEPINEIVYSFIIKSALNGSHGSPGLRARHVDHKWPDSLKSEINGWLTRVPNWLKALIDQVPGHQSAVVFLPIILAYSTLEPQFILRETSDIKVRFLIQQIKEFDSEWFETAFDYTQGLLLTQKHQK